MLIRIRLLLLTMATSFLPAGIAADEAKLPVPEQAAQEQSLALVRDIYKEDLAAAKQPKDKALLAKKLLEQGIGTTGDSAGKYVLLNEALRLAVEANDISAGSNVVDAIGKSYSVDRLGLKASVLGRFSKSTLTTGKAKAIIDMADKLVDEAVAADSFDTAAALIDAGVVAAKNSKQSSLAKNLAAKADYVQEMCKAHEAARSAFDLLDKEPADPGANLQAGKHTCFVKGNWETGLPLLALGSDERLKEIALRELAKPQEAQQQLDLADRWWDIASAANGIARDSVHLHSASWYEQALPRLTGLSKAKATKRLEEVAKTISTDSAARLVARPNSPVAAVRRAEPRTATASGETVGRYRMLRLNESCTCVSSKSMFTGLARERLIFPQWGRITVNTDGQNVPFYVIEPKDDAVKNAIVLCSPLGSPARQMPHFVTIACRSPASAIHILGAVCGWAEFSGGKKTVSVVMRLIYSDGTTENHELLVGEHISTYCAAPGKPLPEVPRSKLAVKMVTQEDGWTNQVRHCRIVPANRQTPISEIEFIKGTDESAPVVMALTIERP